MGKNFIVGQCRKCSQLILIDPAYYDRHKETDNICEACKEETKQKYLNFLKLKL